jgi:hypothetical protein
MNVISYLSEYNIAQFLKKFIKKEMTWVHLLVLLGGAKTSVVEVKHLHSSRH